MKIRFRIVICTIFVVVFVWHICEVHHTLSSFDKIDIQLQNIQEQLDSLMVQ